jgi:hypothetical protein
MKTKRSEGMAGQTLLEFTFVVLVTVILMGEGGRALWQQWYQVGCFYHAFEATHARLIGAAPHRSSFPTRFEGSGNFKKTGSIKGIVSCGRKTESVELPTLESAEW